MATEVELLSQQAELMQQMNSLLKEQAEYLSAIAEQLTGQAQLSRDAATAAASVAPAMDSVTESTDAANESLKKTTESSNSFTDSIKKFVGDKAYDRFTTGLNEGTKLLVVNFDSLAQIVSNPVAAALGFLGELYDVIILKAAELAKESQQLAIAMERVREKFGSFNENTSRRVRTAFNEFGNTLTTTAENARQFGRKFEPGVQGSIKQLEKMIENAEALGPVMDVMGQQFNDAADNLYLLRDGLHFTDAALKQTAVLANLSGKSLKGFSSEIMASINKIGKQFNVSTKVLGKDVGAALSNFKMLGRMTGDYVKEITKAAVFTRKLGIELNELTGIIDKFDEFEGGAEAAAQLAQGFGMVIDPLKMMGMEAGPRLQELQRAFMATGRSIEAMSRVERKLLADTAGLSEEQALLAFSSKGMAMSYDEIAAGAEAATRKQKTTEQIMNDVLDNIENVIMEFKEFTGFITAFFEGFGRGFMGEGSVMSVIRQLAKQLLQVAHIGEQVGRMFATVLFGGDTKTSGKAVLGIFSRIGDMFVEISEHIKGFVSLMNSGDIASASRDLFSKIFGSIEKMFTGSMGGINITGILSKIGKFLVDMLRGAIRFVLEKIPEYTTMLKSMFTEDGGGGFLGEMVTGIGEAIKSLAAELNRPEVIESLREFGNAVIDAIKRFFEKYPVAELLATGPLATFGAGLVGGVFEMFKTGISGGNLTAAATQAQAQMAPPPIPPPPRTGVLGMWDSLKQNVSGVTGAVTGAASSAASIAKGAAAAGAVAVGIAAIPSILSHIAEGIRNAILVFVAPVDDAPDEYKGKSTIDILALAVKKFEGISADQISAVSSLISGMISSSATIAGLQITGMRKLEQVDIDTLKSSVATVIQVISGAIDSMTGPEMRKILSRMGMFATNSKLLQSASDSIASLTSSLKSITASFPKASDLAGVGAESDTVESKMRQAVGIVVGMFKDKDGSPGILTQVSGLVIPPGLTADKVKSINEIVGLVSKMGATTGELVALGKSGGSVKDITHALTLAMTIGDNMEPVLTSFSRLVAATKMAEGEIKMKAALSIINSYLDGMGGITPSKLTAAAAVSFDDPAFAPLMTSEAVGYGFQDIANALADQKLLPDAKNFTANQKKMDAMFETLVRYADGMADISTRLSKEKVSAIEERVKALLQHSADMNKILNDLGNIDINATIDRLEKGMNVAKQTFNVAGGAVKINVNLNVTMNAEKMAGQMVLDGYLAPSTEFNEYLQNENTATFDGLSSASKSLYYNTSGVKQALE